MKRFHVHVTVKNLDESIRFYSALFAASPIVSQPDYAKWMLDDPRINFAISTRSSTVGIDHLGIQTDDAEELSDLRARAKAADLSMIDEGETSCCYSRSEKQWITDPQGIAWEHFRTLRSIPVFNESHRERSAEGSACCAPKAVAGTTTNAATKSGSCC